MIVYLDQNKWIELARAVNRVESSSRAGQIARWFECRVKRNCVLPFSAIHLMELARIQDSGRRSRLGRVIWNFSKGATTAPLKDILLWELEVAFADFGYNITPREFKYVGHGIQHAFGETLESPIAARLSNEIDEAALCGMGSIPPIYGVPSQPRHNFANHLRALHEKKTKVPPEKRENWLYAISMADIREPLNEVMAKHRIPKWEVQAWSTEYLMGFIERIPTRKLDVHLHRQVLKNSQYRSKETDLEDWAALGPAMCYADLVICEKHFADLVRRDGFSTNSRVETDLFAVVDNGGISPNEQG